MLTSEYVKHYSNGLQHGDTPGDDEEPYLQILSTCKHFFGKRRDAVQEHADDQLSDIFAQCEIIAHFRNVSSFIPSVHIIAIYFGDVCRLRHRVSQNEERFKHFKAVLS